MGSPGESGEGLVSKSDEIREYLLKHYPCQAIPHGHLTEIGEKFGVSRELVRQVANKNGLSGRFYLEGQRPECIDCGRKFTVKNPKFPRCAACRAKANMLELTCDECGAIFQRPLHVQRAAQMHKASTNGFIYCSRRCLGLHAARAYGFVAHPENARRHKKVTA